MTSNLVDEATIARARAGDHEAFRVLVEAHQGRLFRLAARVLRDEDLARDAVQEAFLKAYVSLRRFEGRSSLYTWLYRLTLNVCLDMRRRSKSDRTVEWPEVQLADGTFKGEPIPASGTEPPAAGPDAELERSEIRQRVGQAIAGELAALLHLSDEDRKRQLAEYQDQLAIDPAPAPSAAPT